MRNASQTLTYALLAILILTACFSIPPTVQGQRRNGNGAKPKPTSTTPATESPDAKESEMRASIERYTVDRGSLQRSFPLQTSPVRRERFKQLYSDWLASLLKMNFDSMSQDGKVDYILFKNHLEYELRQLDIQTKQLQEIEPLVPFGKTVIDLEETRRRMEPIDSAKIAV